MKDNLYQSKMFANSAIFAFVSTDFAHAMHLKTAAFDYTITGVLLISHAGWFNFHLGVGVTP